MLLSHLCGAEQGGAAPAPLLGVANAGAWVANHSGCAAYDDNVHNSRLVWRHVRATFAKPLLAHVS